MANHAVVIGIDRYATDLTSLDGAVADAQAFAAWLVESGEVPAANLRLGLLPTAVSQPDPPSLAGCARIGTTVLGVNEALGRLLKEPPDDLGRFYFFFSGHGASSSNPAYPEEAICLEGFTDSATINALELSSLMSVLNAIPAEERFVLIDGCRNAMFSDEIRFGVLSSRPRPAKGQRRNFVLRATGPGRKAAELSRRGLFARHLCDGLRGSGSAKRWDPAAAGGDGGYTVRWRALAQYVAAKVMENRAAQRHEQLTFEEGEHPADADPLLASFPETHFPKSKVVVQLVAPETPPARTAVFLRRNDSIDPDRSEPLPAAGRVEFEVPPSAWVLWAQAAGWRAQPRSKALQVYADRVEETITLVAEPDAAGAGRERGDAVAAGMTERGMPEPDFTARAAPAADSLEFDHFPAHETPSGDGQLHVSVDGAAPGAVLPPVRVVVRRESGDVVADPLLEDRLRLPPGVYRVRLELARGASTEASVLIDPGEVERLALQMPDESTIALARTLSAAGKPLPESGFALPSEAMGRLAAPSVATVAAIAVAQAVNGDEHGLVRLGNARRWAVGDAIGVEALIADEREAVDPAETLAPRARLWQMGSHNPVPLAGELLAANPDAPIRSASLVAEAGGWWFQFRDQNRARRAGFKLSTQVLPGHVTLVVRHQLESGAVHLHQYAVRRDVPNRLDIQRGLVQAEALQQARAMGRDPVADPTVLALARGAWFEPFSALVAAAALLDRGAAGEAMFEQVLDTLVAHDIRGPDVAVLKAARATLRGQDDLAAALIRDALGMRQAPIVDALLERLDAEARRLRIAGPQADWIAAKLAQTVGHPLWTLRREDDLRKSGKPDAG